MSVETLPTYPNLFELDLGKLLEIETNCRKAKHLGQDEKLLDIISNNLSILRTLGLTKEDIYTNHRNMYLKINGVDEFSMFTCDDHTNHTAHAEELFANLPPDFGKNWALVRKYTNEIMLNNQHLSITCYIWNGAEQCPIEESFTDKYFGYQRGDRDWFVTNLDSKLKIWIPDLIPAQIGMFGFAHGISPYKLDLELYTKVMGLDRPHFEVQSIKLLSTHKKYYWGSPSSPSLFKKDEIIILGEIDNDIYNAICFMENSENNQKILQIQFYDEKWKNQNKNSKIIVFDLELDVYYSSGQTCLQCRESDCIILDEKDDSDSIDTKLQYRFGTNI